MPSTSCDGYRLVSNHQFVEIKQRLSNLQNALFACNTFRAGDMISDFSAGTISAEPTYLTVQIGAGKHITLQPEFLQYVNHSCDPNVFFDTATMKLVALKDINTGDELVFFYPSTEWKMDQGFQCYCGSTKCLGDIRGAAYLSRQVLKKYKLTEYIQEELSRRTTRKVA